MAKWECNFKICPNKNYKKSDTIISVIFIFIELSTELFQYGFLMKNKNIQTELHNLVYTKIIFLPRGNAMALVCF